MTQVESTMKKPLYSESQFISMLNKAENGITFSDLRRKYGISGGSLYKWREKYVGMNVSLMKYMKEQGGENRRLRKMCAED